MCIAELLAGLDNPSLFKRIARRHCDAFAWRPNGRIPLGIHVVNPQYAEGLNYCDWLNPKPFLEFQARVLADTLAVGSDLLPAVALNHFGTAVITSMFGADLFMPEGSSSTLQDVGPTPLPVFSTIEETISLEMPAMDAGIMPDVERMALYYRDGLPEWVHVVGPMPVGPFTTAMQLRGSDILLDMMDRPDVCSRLIDICGRLQAAVTRRMRQLTRSPLERHVSNFGILGPGLRLGEDSIVNLSPTTIKEFFLPACNTVNNICGGRGHVHFCSLAHSRFEHIYPVLADSSEVMVVSSQFGFEYYQNHVHELRGRLAIESFYGDAYRYVCAKYGSFHDWANEFVPKFKNESGLVLYCQVASVDEGRELWAIWEKAHEN